MDLVRAVEALSDGVSREQGREPTFFETSAIMAFEYFRRQGAQIAVLETGMGGRLDATNVIHPEVAVITSISLDHMQVLGDTIAAIAGEKAGIIKEGIPVVSSPQTHESMAVIARMARERQVRLTVAVTD